jgi:hypothetical protein
LIIPRGKRGTAKVTLFPGINTTRTQPVPPEKNCSHSQFRIVSHALFTR